ncbi:MAG: glycosyltransferase [Planctomycetes bacterium]|nr:glycosyltransferase [Planctomycetota bacterium]
MRIAIVNTDYVGFAKWLYEQNPGLGAQSYDEQLRVRMHSLFGIADFWSTALRASGHEARDFLLNVAPLQKRWAREHGVRYAKGPWRMRFRRGVVPWLYRAADERWMYDILEAQLREYRPDVLYCLAIEAIGSEFLDRVRDTYRIAVGQHAAPLVAHDLSSYDLMLSSLPNLVEHFREQGLRSEYFRLAFARPVLVRLQRGPKRYDLVFVGGLAGPHERGAQILERLCKTVNVAVFGYGGNLLPETSAVRAACHPPLWGLEMYQTLRDARLVFNRHIDVAGDYANNMRLYEATGVGTALLTDAKRNLTELFEPEREVLTYRTADECVERAQHYLTHDDEREALAQAGQQRVLREHTWERRMPELIGILERYL